MRHQLSAHPNQEHVKRHSEVGREAQHPMGELKEGWTANPKHFAHADPMFPTKRSEDGQYSLDYSQSMAEQPWHTLPGNSDLYQSYTVIDPETYETYIEMPHTTILHNIMMYTITTDLNTRHFIAEDMGINYAWVYARVMATLDFICHDIPNQPIKQSRSSRNACHTTMRTHAACYSKHPKEALN